MKLIVGLFAVSMLVTSSVYAIDQNGKFMVNGVGSASCGRITDDVKKIHDADVLYQTYIDGVLTGINMAHIGKADFFNGGDSIARYKFVINYCENNPLDALHMAIQQLALKYNFSINQ